MGPGELVEEENAIRTVEPLPAIPRSSRRSSSAMGDLKTSFKKLGDANYAVWKFRMELVLIQEDLLNVVTEQKPENPPADWITKDAKARALIGLSVEDGQLSHVIRAASSKEMWDALRTYHERSSLASKVHVLRKLCSQRLLEGGSMSEHLNEITCLSNRLIAMGEELKEHWVVAMILSSLPESYGSLITALESRPEADLTLEYVKGKLLDEWKRREENQSIEKVLRTGGDESRKPFLKQKLTCHYCGETGHFRRDCKKLVSDKRKQQKPREQKVKLATNDEVEMCLAAGEQTGGALWLLDSGATSHMTNDVRMLDSLDVSRKTSISLADGNKVVGTGIGAGVFRGVNEEGKGVKVKLSDVYHVPALAGSLLSVSKITDEGFEVVFSKTMCKIMKDDVVYLIGERKGGLYHLKAGPRGTTLPDILDFWPKPTRNHIFFS